MYHTDYQRIKLAKCGKKGLDPELALRKFLTHLEAETRKQGG